MATLKNTTINDTGFITLPVGTTAQRPASPSTGMMRVNTTTAALEFYNGTTWAIIVASLPVTSGLVGWYLPDNYNAGIWTDSSGSGNNATLTTGTPSKSTHNGTNFGASSTFTVISGDTRSTGIQFPSAILPSTYTLFHVSRYNFDDD